jgi:DNA-binding CsgD family transcriptional regulator
MPATAARLLIGRDEELEAIGRLLNDRARLPGAVLLHGDAGIGKTSIWLAGIDAAAERGYRVLSCRASEAETRFSYAGLTDLLLDAAADVLPHLPPVQRRALEAALLLGDTSAPADERAVAAAFLAALRLLAAEGPVCLAVDDLQWLDPASTAALRFALSRLGDDALAALFTVRGDPLPWLRRSLAESDLTALEIRGLSLGALHQLVHSRLDVTFPRPTLIRLLEASGGNPFFALELASALHQKGAPLTPGEELPVPSNLDELLDARIDGLDAAALEVAHVVAALADPTVSLTETAIGPNADAGLAEVVAAHVVELDGERIRFTHPLLRSAVAASQTPMRRRSLHARLATIVPTDEERARHLALATVAPDAEIAATLEAAAQSASVRGAPTTAAELAEQALRLTPESDVADARRRLFLAAERHHAAGDTDRAVALLEQARAAAAPGPERAAVLARLGDVISDSQPRGARTLFQEALAEVGDDGALEAAVHLRIATSMRWGAGIEPGVEHATLAVQAASRTGDLRLRCSTIAELADWRFRAGQGLARDEMEKAVALERRLTEWPIAAGPTESFCHQLVWKAELDPARPLLLEILDARRARSEPHGEAQALWGLGFLEWRAGNWEQGHRYATEALELRMQLGHVTPPDEFPAAIIDAHRGRVDDARRRAEAAMRRAGAAGIEIGQSGHGWVLGFVELSLGNPAAALGHLRPSYEVRDTFMREPAMRVELGDLLEALIATGELDEAEAILPAWEDRARALDRAWSRAVLHRCRGLLLAARGDLDGAFREFDRALGQHDRDVDPFSRARTMLALGRVERRAKKRGAARATLGGALERFERLGAPLWAEQARADLKRIGGRAPSRGDLTVAEQRIAGLVAEGRTNRDVAAALFLTEHSVETALTRIYRKLGVRSRAELTRRLPKT